MNHSRLARWGSSLLLVASVLLLSCGGGKDATTSPSLAADALKADVARAGDSFSGNGIYWDPAASGSGLFFEAQGSSGIATVYLYDEVTGKPVWYSALGSFQAQTDGSYQFAGTLLRYSGGQALGSAVVRTPTGVAQSGSIGITFSGLQATVKLPARSFTATRFEFGGGSGLSKPSTLIQPETGIYWNPQASGRGFTVEVQNNLVVFTVYGYDDDGTPTWRVLTADMSDGTATGPLLGYSGGQTLSGGYRAPGAPTSAGTASLSFTNACFGRVQLPGVPAFNIERFPFGGNSTGRSCRNALAIDFKDLGSAQAAGWTVSGGVTFAPGRGGRTAAVFGGTAAPGSIRIPNNEFLKFDDAATFDFWSRIDSGTGMNGSGSPATSSWAMALLAKSHDRAGAALVTNDDGGIGVTSYDTSWSAASCTYPSGRPATRAVGEWVRITAVLSASAGTRIYRNGKLYEDCPGRRPNLAALNAHDLFLGKYSDTWYPLHGALQDVRIYRRALSATEVAALTAGDTLGGGGGTDTSPPATDLRLLGAWSSVEETDFELVAYGTAAANVGGATMGTATCRLDAARSSSTSAMLLCAAPKVASGEQRPDAVTLLSKSNTALARSSVETSTRVFWRSVNGEMYVSSLDAYLYASSSASGPQIKVNVKALNGNAADVAQFAFSSLRLSGGKVCTPLGGLRYQCPALADGSYGVEFRFEQDARTLAGQSFGIYVGASGGATNPPGSGTTPAIIGRCGAAHGSLLATAPSGAALCSAGTASGVAGSGPWSWSCAGSAGGASASCSAQVTASEPPPPSVK